MKHMMLCLYLLLPCFALAASATHDPVMHTDADVAGQVSFAPRPGNPVPGDLIFAGMGRFDSLEQLLAQGPTLITFAWFECRNLCGLILNNLADAGGRLPARQRQSYRVLVVSMDAVATAGEAAAQKQALAQRYPGADVEGRWHYLTGAAGAIRALGEALGYRFVYDPRKQQFAHPAGVIAVDRQGRVRDFRSGVNYRAADLSALLQSARAPFDTGDAPAANPLLLLCYDYDPSSGRYTLAVMKVLRLAALLSLLGLAAALWYWQRRGSRGSS